jgi:hypothetical protein
MAYRDFDIQTLVKRFQLQEVEAQLFVGVTPIQPSDWLKDILATLGIFGLKGSTEKARSEFVVMPILGEIARRNPGKVGIYSGRTLDVDRDRGLNGECDFILTKGEMKRILNAPIFSLVEAKKQDIELGLGQCAAQMLGASLFNQQEGAAIETIFGCVTTGEMWQFLQLSQQTLTIDNQLYFLNQLDEILGILQVVLEQV